MTRQLRALVLIVALALVAVISHVLTRINDDLRPGYEPLPPLADGLPATSFDNPGHAFENRLRARFPIGSPERAMIMELWTEGFTKPGQDGERRWASLTRPSFPCPREWTVTWSVDDNEGLTALSGHSVVSCP